MTIKNKQNKGISDKGHLGNLQKFNWFNLNYIYNNLPIGCYVTESVFVEYSATTIKSQKVHKSNILYEHNDGNVSPVTLGSLSIFAPAIRLQWGEKRVTTCIWSIVSFTNCPAAAQNRAHFHKCNASSEATSNLQHVACAAPVLPRSVRSRAIIRQLFQNSPPFPPLQPPNYNPTPTSTSTQRLSLAIPKGANKVIILSYCSDCSERWAGSYPGVRW